MNSKIIKFDNCINIMQLLKNNIVSPLKIYKINGKYKENNAKLKEIKKDKRNKRFKNS